jgi:hypothetical protein
LGKWPIEWWSKVLEDWPKLSRETRIFLAKAASLMSNARLPGQSYAESMPDTVALANELHASGLSYRKIAAELAAQGHGGLPLPVTD